MEVPQHPFSGNNICMQGSPPGQPKTKPLLFPPCKVCGDKSSGKNFGVFTCNGCRSFFRRVVSENRTFKCNYERNCEVNVGVRLQCRACRYQKSLKVGMEAERVRKQYPRNGELKNPVVNISLPLQTFERTAFVGALLQMFKQAEAQLDVAFEPWFPKTNLRRPSGVGDIYESINTQLRYVVEWAKKLEVFHGLETQSKIALLRTHCTELIILESAKLSLKNSSPGVAPDHFVAANGLKINGRGGNGRGPCTKILDEVVKPCRNLKVWNQEFWCLKALALFNPYTDGLSCERDRENVGLFQQKVKVVLETILAEDRLRMFNLVMVLPALCTVAENLRIKFSEYRKNNSVVTYRLFDDLVVQEECEK